jgi:hypothetical protein
MLLLNSTLRRGIRSVPRRNSRRRRRPGPISAAIPNPFILGFH